MHETVQALNTVGASEFAALLSRAIDLFPGRHVPSDIEERNASLDALPDDAHEVLEALDQRRLATARGGRRAARSRVRCG